LFCQQLAAPLLLGASIERWNDKEAVGVENHIYSKMPQRATKGGNVRQRQRATIFADNDFETIVVTRTALSKGRTREAS
jgi:hypothetical protein